MEEIANISSPSSRSNPVKSEEVQAIIDRMPTYWVKWIVSIVGFLMAVILILASIIKYPETVDGQISITAHTAPVRIVSNADSRIHLIKPDKSVLCEGDVISYLETGADYKHILLLDSLLQEMDAGLFACEILPDTLMLGDISSNYNAFAVVYAKYWRLLKSDIYENIRQNLQEQILSDEQMIINLDRELELKKKILANSEEQLHNDSILMTMNGISIQEYKEKYNAHLSLYESYINIESTRLSKQAEISKNRLEEQRITLEETENRENTFAELVSQKNALINVVKVWKEKYLQYAPIDGELEYLGFWRNHTYIHSGQELFSIIPPQNEIIGEVKIPSYGAGKVKIGQKANVKINNYPYDEYGLLKGTVQSMSRTTHRIENQQGSLDVYLVKIDFPNGMVTNFGRELPLDSEINGTVEIITTPKRLIQRLFDNLKSKAEK